MKIKFTTFNYDNMEGIEINVIGGQKWSIILGMLCITNKILTSCDTGAE